MLKRLFAAVAVTAALGVYTSAQTKLLRFPDIFADRVVFTYGGDLWTSAASGGTAMRLTAHPGVETYAKYSPDGKWIAFTGQYDGDEQVYVMPAGGGEPKQLTFYPSRGPLEPLVGFAIQFL
jgi:tricorn protease